MSDVKDPVWGTKSADELARERAFATAFRLNHLTDEHFTRLSVSREELAAAMRAAEVRATVVDFLPWFRRQR